jgi:CHASE3 domain sensor protein
MKIRDKLLLTFIFIALSFGALGYIEHRHISEVTDFFQEQETQRSSALTALLELITATRLSSVEAMGYAMHGKPEV